MKNKIKSQIEWGIAIVLVILCLNTPFFAYGSFSPIGAHEESERTYHYGPSEIIKTIDLYRSKIYICRYKDWYSTSIVKKGIIKWYTGGESIGNKIDPSLPISYTWGFTSVNTKLGINKIYGYVSDSDINAVQVESKDGKLIMKYELDDSRMFIFYWEGVNELYRFNTIKGIDSSGKVIYEITL